MKYRIVEISPLDAYYADRGQLIGQVGEPVGYEGRFGKYSPMETSCVADGYFRTGFIFDGQPIPYNSGKDRVFFCGVKLEEVKRASRLRDLAVGKEFTLPGYKRKYHKVITISSNLNVASVRTEGVDATLVFPLCWYVEPVKS